MYKVLVITDTQVDFITGVLGNKECQEVIPKIVNLIENEHYDLVFVTQDTHHEENYFETQEGKKLPILHTVEGTHGWKVVSEIETALKKKYHDKSSTKVIYIQKPTFGGISIMNSIKTVYDEVNSNLQIDFVGVCTGICVISNAIPTKMFAPEATVRIIADCCADTTPEDHEIALKAMEHCQIDIIR